MKIIVDTNVISELFKPRPDVRVSNWFDLLRAESFTTAITYSEIMYGINLLPDGVRKRNFYKTAEQIFVEDFPNKVLPFDQNAGHEYSLLMAECKKQGTPMGVMDAQIAAITITHGATLATRNIKDFEECGIKLENPWEG